jgi:hypothetical protein
MRGSDTCELVFEDCEVRARVCMCLFMCTRARVLVCMCVCVFVCVANELPIGLGGSLGVVC